MPASRLQLEPTDATELAEMLTLISQWLASSTKPSSPPHSTASSAPTMAMTSPSYAPILAPFNSTRPR